MVRSETSFEDNISVENLAASSYTSHICFESKIEASLGCRRAANVFEKDGHEMK